MSSVRRSRIIAICLSGVALTSSLATLPAGAATTPAPSGKAAAGSSRPVAEDARTRAAREAAETKADAAEKARDDAEAARDSAEETRDRKQKQQMPADAVPGQLAQPPAGGQSVQQQVPSRQQADGCGRVLRLVPTGRLSARCASRLVTSGPMSAL